MAKKSNELILCNKDKLVILGTADTRAAAPYEDKEFEIWGVAPCVTYPDIKRVDLQFELHTEGYWRDKDVTARLKRATVPIYMQKKHKDIPKSIRFPIETVVGYRKYFTTAIGYMLALAYHSFVTTEKPRHIAIFGVHMSSREEYTEQRPCCEYWLGRLEGAGVDLFLAPGGALLTANGLYGYENYDPICYSMRQRITSLRKGYDKADKTREQWLLQRAKNEGAIYEAEYWLRRFQRGENKWDSTVDIEPDTNKFPTM